MLIIFSTTGTIGTLLVARERKKLNTIMYGPVFGFILCSIK